MSFASLMTHVITVRRPSQATDAAGGTTRGASPPAVSGLENVAASVQPMNAREKLLFGQRNVFLTHKIYLEGNQTALLRQDDLVENIATGKTYRIVGVEDAAGRDHHTVIHAVERL